MSKRGDRLQNKGARGSRKAASQRAQSVASSPDSKQPSRLRRWAKRGLLGGGALALLALVFLAFAVGFAAQSIPSYATLQA
ncbi:MAG: penicillin-binding protein, partial [Erythrobacter sp.]|nr:penicillin-binding protein [Erythrobacter sp.]